MIDRNGRLFGRFNLVDTAAVIFVVFLIPVGYATYLLFRPAKPTIESVTRVEITKEERRVAGGSMLSAKLKVRGSGLNPLLRAWIGGTESLGFVFENPNSADVLVGLVPPGRHDLILYDGVQEVARASAAVEILATSGPSVRAYGWLTNLSPQEAEVLKAGFASDQHAPGAFQIVAVEDSRPGRSRITFGTKVADLPMDGRVERQAEILIRCDWPSAASCTIGGEALTEPAPINVTLPGGYTFQMEEIAPPMEPKRATVRMRLPADAGTLKAGDRDQTVGSRTAEIVSIAGAVVTIRAGVDESREGWRYRGQLLGSGSQLTITTRNNIATGTVMDVMIEPEARR